MMNNNGAPAWTESESYGNMVVEDFTKYLDLEDIDLDFPAFGDVSASLQQSGDQELHKASNAEGQGVPPALAMHDSNLQQMNFDNFTDFRQYQGETRISSALPPSRLFRNYRAMLMEKFNSRHVVPSSYSRAYACLSSSSSISRTIALCLQLPIVLKSMVELTA